MADNKAKHQDMLVTLRRYLSVDDLVGAKRFLHGIDKEAIVSRKKEINAMLFAVAKSGHKNKVEFLVKNCQANINESSEWDIFHSVTPLWCAAGCGRFGVVKLLRELGADLNYASSTGTTVVNFACFQRREKIVKYLVEQGADIHRPDEKGETCLMKSVDNLKLCRFLVDQNARVNAQDNLGNTALHHAIRNDSFKTMKFLLNHGADQNIKNKLGDDALQFASLHGKELMCKKLKGMQKPTISRWIESLQLLGSSLLYFGDAPDVGRALVFWKKSVEIQMLNPCAESRNIEPTPLCIDAKKVNTVEELEELCRDIEMVHIYALEILLRILGPSRRDTTLSLVNVSKVFARNGKYKRHFALLKYALHRLQDCDTPTWKKECFFILKSLHIPCSGEFRETQSEIKFYDVFEILDLMTLKLQSVSNLNETDNISFMQRILSFVLLVVKLEKSPDQLVSFQQAIRRLVHSQIRERDGRTLLHLVVERCDTYPGVAKVLLECGADVNAVDSEHNTALHLISSQKNSLLSRSGGIYGPGLRKGRNEIIKLLFQYSAHPDIVNDHGYIAATGLSLNMLDHVNLKCLATAVIRDHQIPYVGQIPKSLESFVQMHGRRPSKKFPIRYPFTCQGEFKVVSNVSSHLRNQWFYTVD